jgi:FkbM family methyltransferase
MSEEIVELTAYGKTIRMYDTGGKIPEHWRTRGGYERVLLDDIYHSNFTGVAVDVGASIGNHTLWMAGICGLNVVAFEPIVYDTLWRNLELNPEIEQNVIAYPIGLGAKSVHAEYLGKGRLAYNETGGVRLRRLDDHPFSPISVIKIDVEGMEAEVLKGAVQTIKRDLPVIYTEEWSDTETTQIAEVLHPLGYVRKRTIPTASPMGRWEYEG